MNRFLEKISAFNNERHVDAQYRPLRDAQEEQSATTGRPELRRLSYRYGVLVAVGLSFLSGFIGILASNRWLHHNMDSVCIEHTSQRCKLAALLHH